MSEKTTGTIIAPNGEEAAIPTFVLEPTEAELLRNYKKFLLKYNLAEALYCKDCWNRQISDGCEARVTDGSIIIKCRCKLRFYQGLTF